MTADELRIKKEHAEKVRIIEVEIESPIKTLGGHLPAERKTRLKTMTIPELQKVAQELQSAKTRQVAFSMIVKALCASADSCREEENSKDAALSGQARTDMEL